MSSPSFITFERLSTEEQLRLLVYELLDAHDDTARLAAGPHDDPRWPGHLHYLRDLQRVGRELLAQSVGEQSGD